MSRFAVEIALEHPVLFLADPLVEETIPPGTGAAAVTNTSDCICFRVQSYVDGDAVVTVSEEDCEAGVLVFDGKISCPSGVLSLSDSHRFAFLNIPVEQHETAVRIWMSEAEQPEWVWVRLAVRAF